MSEEFKNVETEIWNPEEQSEITGTYIGVQKEVGVNKSHLYSIRDSKGKVINIWGSKILDGKMLSATIGQEIEITFNGKVKKEGGNDYNSYDVGLKPLKD